MCILWALCIFTVVFNLGKNKLWTRFAGNKGKFFAIASNDAEMY